MKALAAPDRGVSAATDIEDLTKDLLVYREAEKAINSGLSFGARLAIAISASLLAIMLLIIDTPSEKNVFVYLFVIFCFLIALACVVKGRLRKFIGSFIGLGLFIISLLYLASMLVDGIFWSSSRSEPSVKNAILFMLAFGVPGLTYVIKAKFGFRKH